MRTANCVHCDNVIHYATTTRHGERFKTWMHAGGTIPCNPLDPRTAFAEPDE